MATSAFGVDHGAFSKSMLPGGVFKPIKGMNAAQKARVRQGGHYKATRGATKEDRDFKEMMRNTREEVRQGGLSGGVRHIASDKLRGGSAGTIKFGGKSSREAHISGEVIGPKADRDATVLHEKLHAKPRRSAYRLHRQIMDNPKKLFREEGRADYFSTGHYDNANSTSAYATAARAQKRAQKDPDRVQAASQILPRTKHKSTWKPNRRAAAEARDTIGQALPHYPKGDDLRPALAEYSQLQDKLKAKGAKQGKFASKKVWS